MASLTKPRILRERKANASAIGVAAATNIFEGALVALNGVVAIPADNVAAHRVVGVATMDALNGSGAAGDIKVEAVRGCFAFDNDAGDAVGIADLGANCYVTDDHTVCKTAGTKPVAGVIFDVDSAGVWVRVG